MHVCLQWYLSTQPDTGDNIWAREHLSWTRNQWDSVMFSDERSFTLRRMPTVLEMLKRMLCISHCCHRMNLRWYYSLDNCVWSIQTCSTASEWCCVKPKSPISSVILDLYDQKATCFHLLYKDDNGPGRIIRQ